MNGALVDVAARVRIGDVRTLHDELRAGAHALGTAPDSGGQTPRPVAGAPPPVGHLSDTP